MPSLLKGGGIGGQGYQKGLGGLLRLVFIGYVFTDRRGFFHEFDVEMVLSTV